ncbi:1059_t:CDS:2, partial [Cetraspora pellucida]
AIEDMLVVFYVLEMLIELKRPSNGARLKYSELEAELLEWFRDARAQQKIIS